MRISFERTGGVAGMSIAATIDTEALPAHNAQELLRLVDAASFFDLPATIRMPAQGADQFHYKLTVEDEARRHTVEVGDAAAPAALQPLLRQLTILARQPRDSHRQTG